MPTFLFFAIKSIPNNMAATIIASQTVLALVKKIQKQIRINAIIASSRQKPEKAKLAYKTKGIIRNNAEAKRFLWARVAYMT